MIRSTIAFLGVMLYSWVGFQWIDTYSLWDDEANTALFAQTVRQTGDTSAILGNNIIAFRNGAELNEEKKARYVSPLQYYFLAPFIGDGAEHPPTPVRARLPFFALSLISLALIYRRLLKLNVRSPLVAAFCALSLGLTSLLLFGIQSRYYALTFFFALLLSDQYFFGKLENRKQWIRFGVVGALLFISNYLIGVATLATLAVHFLFLRRGDWKKALPAIFPHLLISLPVFLIWNPLGKKVVEMHNTPLDRLNLLFRNVRDFNGGHLGSLLLLILGMVLWGQDSRKRFRTYGILLITYLITISLLSPQPVRGTGQADIRYLYPLMLLSFAWMLDFFQLVLQKNRITFAAAVVFFSFCSLPYSGQLRFHFEELIGELSHPADDPYRLVADQLAKEANPIITPTVYSSLDYATYPLMFLQPQFQYIQSEPKSAPDYLVSFCAGGIQESIGGKFKVQYVKIAEIPSFCREAYRPEVFLRTFGRNQARGTIEIYKLSSRLTP